MFLTFKTYKSAADILLSGFQKGSKIYLGLINVYAPYSDGKGLWGRVEDSGILDLSSLIMVGDFNLTMDQVDIWGTGTKEDRLGKFFRELFSLKSLKDIWSDNFGTTLSNGCLGKEGIS